MLLDTTKILGTSAEVQIGSVTLPLGPANIVAAEALFATLDDIDLQNLVQPIAASITAFLDAGTRSRASDEARTEMLNENITKLDRVEEIDAILAADTTSDGAAESAYKHERDGLLEQVEAHTKAVMAQPMVNFSALVSEFLEREGGQIIAKVKPILGRQFIPAIRNAVLAVIDTESTFNALTVEGGPLFGAGATADRDLDGCYIGCSRVRGFVKQELLIGQGVEILAVAMKVNDLVGALGKFVGGLTISEPPEVTATA